LIHIDTWGTQPTARFMKNGFRFIVRPNDVLVYERQSNGSDYTLNQTATENRRAYDSKRYQIAKNRTVIDALQTVMNT